MKRRQVLVGLGAITAGALLPETSEAYYGPLDTSRLDALLKELHNQLFLSTLNRTLEGVAREFGDSMPWPNCLASPYCSLTMRAIDFADLCKRSIPWNPRRRFLMPEKAVLEGMISRSRPEQDKAAYLFLNSEHRVNSVWVETSEDIEIDTIVVSALLGSKPTVTRQLGWQALRSGYHDH